MTFVNRTLTLGNYTFTALTVLCGLAAVWMWVQAFLAWGPAPFAEALFWSLATGVFVALVMSVEYVQEWGE